MIVDTETLLILPIGTLFHEMEFPTTPIYEIMGYSSEGDILVRPLFCYNNMEYTLYGFKDMDQCKKNSSRWYVLEKEDCDYIARKMGFESAGIKIIGLKSY